MNNINIAIKHTIAKIHDINVVTVTTNQVHRVREILESYLVEDFSEVTKAELDKAIIEAVKIERESLFRHVDIHAAARDWFLCKLFRPVNN